MIEDLKNLKRKLENEKYVVITDIGVDPTITISNHDLTLSEIAKLDNTNKVIASCEELMMNAIELFTPNFVAYDSLRLSTNLGLISKKDFAEKVAKDRKLFPELYPGNISSKYAFVEFGLDLAGCKVPEEIIPANVNEPHDLTYLYKNGNKELRSLLSTRVSGIVDIEKLIRTLKGYGYQVNMLNYGPIANFSDYINKYAKSTSEGKKALFCIDADLKENQKVFGSK